MRDRSRQEMRLRRRLLPNVRALYASQMTLKHRPLQECWGSLAKFSIGGPGNVTEGSNAMYTVIMTGSISAPVSVWHSTITGTASVSAALISSRHSHSRPSVMAFTDRIRSRGKSADTPRHGRDVRCVGAWKFAVDRFQARGRSPISRGDRFRSLLNNPCG